MNVIDLEDLKVLETKLKKNRNIIIVEIIVIVFLTIFIVNLYDSKGSCAIIGMDQQAKNMYNANMESYLGTNKKGSEIKSLIQAVIDSNNQYAGESGKFVQITTSGIDDTNSEYAEIGTAGESDNDDSYVSNAVATMSKLKSEINTGKKYNINAEYKDGLIISINIQQIEDTIEN